MLVSLDQEFLTFLMFPCFLGGRKDELFLRYGRVRKKSPSPHRKVIRVMTTQAVKLEFSQI